MQPSSERNIRFKSGFIASLENEETGASPSVSIMRAFRLMADYIESLMGSVGRVLGVPSSRRRQMGRRGSGWSSSRLRAYGRWGVWVGVARRPSPRPRRLGPARFTTRMRGVGLGGSSPGAAAYKDGRKKSGGGREVSEDDK